jgi:phage head maturation protease
MVRRGDYSGCSFEFWPDEYDIEERDGGKDVKITHKKFRAITALTIGMDPAYKQTSVNARELWENTPAGKREKEKESQMQREAMQREMNRRVANLQRIASFDREIENNY